MYNLRYHIASLAGVFLALALGLILGGLVVGQGTLGDQQGALVEGLRKEFASLRTENQALSDQNELLSEYATMMTDDWVAGRLSDKAIVVLTSSGRSDELKASTKAIEGAGGTVVTVTVSEAGLDLGGSQVASIVASVTGEPGGSKEKTAALLVAEWTSVGVPRPLTDALVEADVLKVDGLTQDVAVSATVDVAAPENEPSAAALAIARAFADTNLPAVAGQTPLGDSGLAVAGASVGVSAFDTLGTDVGRYTLVALLSGVAQGYYGVGDGATAPFPPLPEP